MYDSLIEEIERRLDDWYDEYASHAYWWTDRWYRMR